MSLMDAYAAQPQRRAPGGAALLPDLDDLTRLLEQGGSRAVLAEIPDEPRWALLREVLRLSAAALDDAPELLPSQLLGRLPRDSPCCAGLLVAAARRRGLAPLSASLARPVRPLLATLRGHRDFVGGLVVLPGDRVAVSASEDHTIRTWDLVRGVGLQVLTAHSGPVNRLLLVPGGRQLLSCSDDRTIRVWDAASMLCVAVLHGHHDYVSAMACSPDGRTLVSAGRDGAVLVWDLPQRTLRCRFAGHTAWVVATAISPDGRTAVTSSVSNELWAWDLEHLCPDRPFYDSGHGDVRYVLGDIFVGDNNTSGTGHRSYARALAFSPDGRRLVSGRDGLIVWDVATRQQVRRLHAHGWPIDSMAVLPDGRLATGAHSIKLWDMRQGAVAATLPGHDGNDIDAIVPLSDGRLLSSGHDGALRLWDPTIDGEPVHTGRVSGVRFSPCGRHLVSAASDGCLRVWSASSGACEQVLGGFQGTFAQVKGFVPGPVPGVLGATSDGELRLWALQTGQLRAAMRHPTQAYSIEGVAITADGSRAVAGAVGQGLTLWDLRAGGAPLQLDGRGRFLSHVRILPDGDTILTAASYQGSGEPGQVQQWSLSGRRRVAQQPLDGQGYATGMRVFGDDVIVAGSRGRLYRVARDPLRIVERVLLGEGRDWIQLLPGAGELVTLHRGVLRRWDPRDLSRSVVLGRLEVGASLAARDGDLLVYAVGADVFLWSLSRKERLGRFRADARVSALAIRGDRVAIGEHSGRVHLARWVP